MGDIVDESSYVHYAENVIFDLQRTFRKKPGVEDLPVIEASMNLEEICFTTALKESGAAAGDTLWSKKGCAALYQHKCEKMLRNLEIKDYNWVKILEEHSKQAKIIFNLILKEDRPGAKKSLLEMPYRPPKSKVRAEQQQYIPPQQVIDNRKAQNGPGFSSTQKLSVPAHLLKKGNKGRAKGKNTKTLSLAPAPAPAASGAASINAAADWMKGSTVAIPANGSSGVGGGVSVGVDVDVSFDSTLAGDDLLFDDLLCGEVDVAILEQEQLVAISSRDISIANEHAWTAQKTLDMGGSSSAGIGVGGNESDSSLWQSALAERDLEQNKAIEAHNQRGLQQEAIRKAREDSIANAAAERAAEVDRREAEEKARLERQQQLERTREQERAERERAQQTVTLESDRDLLDEMDF